MNRRGFSAFMSLSLLELVEADIIGQAKFTSC